MSATAYFVLCFGLVSAATDVDTTWMKASLQSHFSEPRHHAMNSVYKDVSKTFILNEFKGYELETHIHTFDTEITEVKGHNVIGIAKGKYFKQPQDRVVGVAAHYDTVRNTPGVDDNGSAVVALLQAAKHLAKFSRDFTVIFVAFDFEEWEREGPHIACGTQSRLCGSAEFVTDWISSFWESPPNITGFIVMDTIMNFNEEVDSQTLPQGADLLFPDVVASVRSDGNQGDFLAAIGRPLDSELLSAFVDAYSALGEPEFELEKINITMLTSSNITDDEFYMLRDLMRSDHYNFWINGYPAIFLTDSANFRGFMGLCYHQSCDQMNRVTDKMMRFAGKTAQAVIDTVNKIAPSTNAISGAEKPTNSFCLGALVLLLLCYSLYMMYLQISTDNVINISFVQHR